MIITMALMRYMVKLALTSKTGIQAVDNFTAGVVDTTERAIGNLPVIPTEWWAIGFKQIWNNGSSPILDARIAKGNSDLQKERQDQVNTVRSAFGWGESIAPLRVDQERSLKSAYAKSKDYRSEFVTQLQKIKNENNGIKFSEVKPLIIDWIKNTESGAALSQFEPYFWASALPIVREIYTKTNSKEGLQEWEENLLLQKLFESTGAAKTFYENVLGGTDHSVATYTMLNNPTYGDVKKTE